MIKVYQLSHSGQNNEDSNIVWSPHDRRSKMGPNKSKEQQRRGAPRASQKGAGNGVAPSSNHPRDLSHWSQGCDCHAVEVCTRQPRLGQYSSPHPRGAETHRRRSGVITNTPPKRTRAFLSKD